MATILDSAAPNGCFYNLKKAFSISIWFHLFFQMLSAVFVFPSIRGGTPPLRSLVPLTEYTALLSLDKCTRRMCSAGAPARPP